MSTIKQEKLKQELVIREGRQEREEKQKRQTICGWLLFACFASFADQKILMLKFKTDQKT